MHKIYVISYVCPILTNWSSKMRTSNIFRKNTFPVYPNNFLEHTALISDVLGLSLKVKWLTHFFLLYVFLVGQNILTLILENFSLYKG